MVRNFDFGSFASFMSGVSDFTGETIFSALGHYFMQPDLWSCPEEGFVLLQLLTVGEMSGHNNFKAAFDPVGNFEVLDKIFYSVFGGSISAVSDPAPIEEEQP